MKDPLGFIPPNGNYGQLQSYRKAEVVYDLRLISKRDARHFWPLLVMFENGNSK